MIFPGRPDLPEMTHHRLRYEKHALQIDVENSVEILFRHVPEVRAFLESRVVDEDVDLPESSPQSPSMNLWPSETFPMSAWNAAARRFLEMIPATTSSAPLLFFR